MTIVSQPDVTITILPAKGNISNAPQKILFIGQKTSLGTATSGALNENIGNEGQEDALFGKHSMLALMIREHKKINKVTRTDAIALSDNGAGTAAAGTVVFAGTATENGEIFVTIGSDANYKFDVTIANGDTATVIGQTLADLINASTTAPFTAVNVTGTVTITSIHKGTVGNSVAYAANGDVGGVSVTLTAPTGGAGNPSLTGLFSVIAEERYQTIIWPDGYTLSTVTTELDNRFNVSNDVLDGVAITTKMDTYANILAYATAENSQSLVILSNKLVNTATQKGGAIVEFNDVISSQFGAIRSLRFTPDASISKYVIATNGARDAFGGAALASLPYFNTPFDALPLIPVGLGFSRVEIESLKDAGASTLGNNKGRTSIIADEIVTTRKTDSAGNPETTFKYLNYVDTSVNIREFFYNNLKARFAQCRLTNGDLIPNRNMANRSVIESFLDGLYTTLSGEDYVLTQAGEEYRNFFRANRSVTLDLQDGLVTIIMTTPIVTQLRTIIATMQIAFSTES